MGKSAKRRQCQPHDVMAGSAAQGRNESDTAGFVVKASVEKV
jgi:hypothetical protein